MKSCIKGFCKLIFLLFIYPFFETISILQELDGCPPEKTFMGGYRI